MQRKTIIALIAILILAASMLCVSAGAEAVAQNGYDAAVRNGDLYFVLPGAAGDALVYVPQNGQAAVLTRAGEISDLTPYNGDLICLATTNDASAILRISGTQVSTLYPFGTERADDLMVHGNQLLVRSDHLLYTIDPSNNVRMKLSGAQMDQYVLEGDNAYYIAAADQIQYGAEGTDATVQAGCIYRLNLQTGENTLLLKSGAQDLNVLSGNLYFHNMADAYAADDAVRGHIYRFAIDRQTLESVTGAPDQGLWVITSGVVALQDGALTLYGAGDPTALYQPAENAAEETVQAAAQDQPAAENEPAETGEATLEQWQQALETAVAQRDEYLDSLRRTQADFQNFKRRNATARSDGYDEGTREAIAALLPAIDNLERALDAAEKAGVKDGLTEGVQMTLNMLMESLKRFGFEEVPALGEDFDPEKHNAVMREAGDTPGKILEVFQKGYRVKDKIIRYAMVKVCTD